MAPAVRRAPIQVPPAAAGVDGRAREGRGLARAPPPPVPMGVEGVASVPSEARKAAVVVVARGGGGRVA